MPPTLVTTSSSTEVDFGSLRKMSNVSPKFYRLSHPRKRKQEEELSIQEIFKMRMTERQEDRKEARERERIRMRRM